MTLRHVPIALILFIGCNASPEKPESDQPQDSVAVLFDPVKWKIQKEEDFPYRKDMIDDLIASSRLKKLSKEEVMQLLGPPTRTDSSYLFYQVEQTRLFMWPLHTTTLVIKLSGDSTENQVMIHE